MPGNRSEIILLLFLSRNTSKYLLQNLFSNHIQLLKDLIDLAGVLYRRKISWISFVIISKNVI